MRLFRYLEHRVFPQEVGQEIGSAELLRASRVGGGWVGGVGWGDGVLGGECEKDRR